MTASNSPYAAHAALPLMIWLSYALFQHLAVGFLRGERSGLSAMNPPVWPFRAVFFIAFTLLALQILVEMIKTGRRFNGGKE